MTKIYQAIGQNSAVLVTNFKGIFITLNFKNGDATRKKWATLSTDNRLVQDAIEADSRFGVTIRLIETFMSEEEKKDAEASASESRKASKSSKKSKQDDSDNGKTFSSSNEAVRWLTEQGLYTGTENVAELFEEHNIKVNG